MGRWCYVPAAMLEPRPIRKKVLARLSVCASAQLQHKQPDQQPSLPPFAGRLCRSKSVTDSRTPSAPLAYAQGSRTLKEKRLRDSSRPRAAAACRRPFHRRHQSREETRPEIPLQLPEGERIIARETECQRHRQCPESAFHNIIPSELCNSRRQRRYSASEEEECVEQKHANTPYRAADYTYLSWTTMAEWSMN